MTWFWITCGPGSATTGRSTSVAPGADGARLLGHSGMGVHERNHGFRQEMEHLVDCVLNDRQPLVTGEDGRAALEIIMGAYESAATGRRVELPLKTGAKAPIEPWLKARA